MGAVLAADPLRGRLPTGFGLHRGGRGAPHLVALGHWGEGFRTGCGMNAYLEKVVPHEASMALRANDCGVFAPLPVGEVPSSALHAALLAEEVRCAALPSRSTCGHTNPLPEYSFVRLGGNLKGRPAVECLKCMTSQNREMPGGCYLCPEPDTYTAAAVGERLKVIVLVDLCYDCADGETQADLEQLVWSELWAGSTNRVEEL